MGCLKVGMITIAALKEAKTLVSLNYHSAKAAGLSDEAKYSLLPVVNRSGR